MKRLSVVDVLLGISFLCRRSSVTRPCTSCYSSVSRDSESSPFQTWSSDHETSDARMITLKSIYNRRSHRCFPTYVSKLNKTKYSTECLDFLFECFCHFSCFIITGRIISKGIRGTVFCWNNSGERRIPFIDNLIRYKKTIRYTQLL